MRRLIVAIDPGVRTGLAALRPAGDGVAELSSVHATRAITWPDCVAQLEALGVGVIGRDALIVVEGQYYLDRGSKQWKRRASSGGATPPVEAVLRLVEVRCRWEHAALALGARAVVVLPGRWIPAMTRGAPGETTKARIAAALRARLPEIPVAGEDGDALTGDARDAALLACWYAEEHGLRVVLGKEVARG